MNRLFEETIERPRVSDFYVGVARYVRSRDWPTLRERIAEMVVLEDEMRSPSTHLFESDSYLRLSERYRRLIEFESERSLRERGIKDLSSEDRDFYEKNLDRFNKSGKFRSKDSYAQRLTKMRKMLDSERDGEFDDVDDMPPEIEERLDQRIEEIAQEGKRRGDGKTALSKIKNLIGKTASKYGGIASDFLKKHSKAINVLTNIGAAIAGVAKVVPIFAPFGPPGWIVGTVVGVAVGLLTKKAAMVGGKLGKDKLAPMLIEIVQKQMKKAKSPVMKKVWGALLSPKGQVIITMICSIVGGIVGGAVVGGGSIALIKKFGPQLFNSFLAAEPTLPAIANDPVVQAEAHEAATEVEEIVAEVNEVPTEPVPPPPPPKPVQAAQAQPTQQPVAQPTPQVAPEPVAAPAPEPSPAAQIAQNAAQGSDLFATKQALSRSLSQLAIAKYDGNIDGVMELFVNSVKNPQVIVQALNSGDPAQVELAKNVIRIIARDVYGTNQVNWIGGFPYCPDKTPIISTLTSKVMPIVQARA